MTTISITEASSGSLQNRLEDSIHRTVMQFERDLRNFRNELIGELKDLQGKIRFAIDLTRYAGPFNTHEAFNAGKEFTPGKTIQNQIQIAIAVASLSLSGARFTSNTGIESNLERDLIMLINLEKKIPDPNFLVRNEQELAYFVKLTETVAQFQNLTAKLKLKLATYANQFQRFKKGDWDYLRQEFKKTSTPFSDAFINLAQHSKPTAKL